MLTMVIVTRFLHFAETKFFILVNVWSETLSKFPNENVSQNLALNIVYKRENDITATEIQKTTLIWL